MRCSMDWTGSQIIDLDVPTGGSVSLTCRVRDPDGFTDMFKLLTVRKHDAIELRRN